LAESPEQLEADESLLEEIRSRYTAARDHSYKWRVEARECFAMYAGDQWSEDDKAKLLEQQRVPVTFNRVSVFVDAVIGYEVNNRQETRYIPRTPGDAKVNELLTEAANYFRDECDAEFEESDAFRDMIICGMGWTNDRLSDETNPDFDLVRDRVDPLSMLWDPSARKPNLADARYFFYETDFSRDEAKALVPEWSGEYIAADWLTDNSDVEPGHNNPRSQYKGEDNGRSPVRDVRVLEYQFCEDKLEHIVTRPPRLDEMTGQMLPAEEAILSDEDWEDLQKESAEDIESLINSGKIKHATKRKRIWRRYFMIGAEPFEKKHPYPEGPTYHCITGKRDRNTGYWFGIVRALMDPQKWSNKFMVQIMHLINSSAKPGYDIEKGAVENQKNFEANSAKPGAINVFTDGSIQKGRVQYRQASGLPPDLSNLLQYSNDAHSDVSGVNAELLGMADREQAGVLEYQRKQSAVTLLAPLFDSFRRYRKMAGRCWLYFMQHYLTDGRLVRITQEEGEDMQIPFQQGEIPNPQFQQQDGMAPGQDMQQQQQSPTIQFFDAQTSKYDVIIDQSASSPNMKEATWMALQPMLPFFMESGDPDLAGLVLEYSPAPESFMQKYRDLMAARAQEPPPPDPEMMKIEAQIQAKQAEMQMKQQEGQQQFALEQQKAQFQLQIEREKMMLEKQKAEMQMQMEWTKFQQELRITQAKAGIQMQTEQAKAEVQIETAKQSAEAENQRANFKTNAEVKRQDKMASAKAKQAKMAKADA
jgi:hypothetical protein